MATQRPVLFMSTRTPVNFQGKRQRQEVRALALRAASFSRPNRKRKPKDVVVDDSTSVSSQDARPPANPRRASNIRHQSVEVQRCSVCGKSLRRAPEDSSDAASDSTESISPRPQVCMQCSFAIAPASVMVPLALSGPNPCDPFDSIPVTVAADTRDFLNYVKSFSFKINWPDELSVCSEGGSLYKAHGAMYSKYFQHPSPMNGLLSYVYNLMAIIQPERAAFHRQKSIEYSLKCFKYLRNLIDGLDHSDEPLMVILQTLWPLTIAEYSDSVRTGIDNSLQHRAALRRLIYLLGGLRRLPLAHRELIANFFAKIAFVTDKPTEIDPVQWDPGPWQGSISNESPVLEASTLINPSAASLDNLSDLLAALRELVAVEMVKRRGSWSDEDHLGPVFRWTYLRRIALKMRLWNLFHPSSPEMPVLDHSRDTRSLQKQNPTHTQLDFCLCIAAQLFIHLSLETHPVRQAWFSAPKQYAQMLEEVKAYYDVRDRSVHQDNLEDSQAQDLLWIVTTGACFGEEMWRRQPRVQSFKLVLTAKAASFWDKEGTPTTLRADGSSDMAEKETQSQWASRRFGFLIRHLGYTRSSEVRDLFMTKYVYDAMFMDAALDRLFDLNQI